MMTNRFQRTDHGYLTAVRPSRSPRGGRRRPLPPLDDARLKDLTLDQLREALRINRVSFPNPVPTFERHDRPDLQWRMAQLYFVLGWSCGSIARRYGVLRQRVCQILNSWKRRALEMGYIQYIPPPQSGKLPGHAIQAVLAPALGRAMAPVPAFVPGHNQGLDRTNAIKITAAKKSPRPRSKADPAQIVGILRQLAAGRTAAELALEAGVSISTLRDWRQKYGLLAEETEEMRMLRDENAQLKTLLMDMSAKKTLMGPIRKSYGAKAREFMPFSQ